MSLIHLGLEVLFSFSSKQFHLKAVSECGVDIPVFVHILRAGKNYRVSGFSCLSSCSAQSAVNTEEITQWSVRQHLGHYRAGGTCFWIIEVRCDSVQEGITIPQRERERERERSFWVSSSYLGLMMQLIGTYCSLETKS